MAETVDSLALVPVEVESETPDSEDSGHALTPRSQEKGKEKTGSIRPEAYKTRLCRNWMDNKKCLFAQNCAFAHGEEELQPHAPTDGDSHEANRSSGLRGSIRPEAYKTSLCRHWVEKGKCPFAESCVFAHGESELRVNRSQRPNGDSVPALPAPPSRLIDSLSSDAPLQGMEPSKLMFLLSSCQLYLQEADLRIRDLEAALAISQRERLADQVHMERQTAIQLEDYKKRIEQLGEIVAESVMRHAALEGALKQAKTAQARAEQEVTQAQARLKEVFRQQEEDKKIRARMEKELQQRSLLEEADGWLETVKKTLEKCEKLPLLQPREEEALAKLQLEHLEAVLALKKIHHEKRQRDKAVDKLIVWARRLKELVVKELGHLHNTYGSTMGVDQEDDATEHAMLSQDADLDVAISSASSSAVSTFMNSLQIKFDGSMNDSTKTKKRSTSDTMSLNKRSKQDVPPCLPSELLRSKSLPD